jgi:hypothetical protein
MFRLRPCPASLSAWGRSARPQVEALRCHAGQSLRVYQLKERELQLSSPRSLNDAVSGSQVIERRIHPKKEGE